MALPVTIAGTKTGDQNSYHGPFKSSGGAFYTILIDDTDISLVEAWKATDPTSSFAEQDTANRPDFNGAIKSLWVFQKGDALHVSAQDDTDDGWYARFDMATDTWVDIDGAGDRDVPITTMGANNTAQACSIAVEETGSDIVVAYQGDARANKDMGSTFEWVAYAKSTDSGQTWSTGNAVADTNNIGETDFTGPVVVRGSSDRMHIFFALKFDPGHKYQRTLRSNDTLEAFPAAFDTTTITKRYPFSPGVAFASGANTKVRISYIDEGSPTNNVGSVAGFNSADTPSVSVTENVTGNTINFVNNSPVLALAVDADVQHLLYADNVDKDLFRDETGADDDVWGTDVEVLDAVTINHVSSNVYDRSAATELAYVYDDAGTIKYNEVELAAAGDTLSSNDSGHTHSADAATLGQTHVLVAQDATHGHAVDQAPLSETKILAVEEATHAHTGTSPDLVKTLSAQDASHAHPAGGAGLVQNHVVGVADASHAHTADIVAISVSVTLGPDDATHGHTSDATAFDQSHVAAADDATHGHSSDATTLTQVHDLAAQDAAHGHTADAATLAQVHSLTADDTLHDHAADAATLVTAGEDTLAADDAVHGHTADEATFVESKTLAVDEATHAHSADAASFAQTYVLAADDAEHAHAADAAELAQIHALVAANATHGHAADAASFEKFAITVGAGRTIAVKKIERTAAAARESRVVDVADQS